MVSKLSNKPNCKNPATVYFQMGAGVSQERLKELHWGRDVSKLFNCAKMVDQVSCHPKFFTSLVADSGTLFYCAISEDGRVVGTRFLSAEERASFGTPFLFEPLGGRAETLAAIASAKAERGGFTDVFEPFYMRKSQAERAKDEV